MPPKPLLPSVTSTSEAGRDARRFLAAHVRTDWAYPSIAEGSRRSSATEASVPKELHFKPVTWKEREYSSGDQASDQSASEHMDVDQQAGAASTSRGSTEMAAQTQSRKRTCAQMLEEEMTWNAGLAHYIAERDAWTCARIPAAVTVASVASAIPARLGRSSDDSLNSGSLHQSAPSTPASSPPPAHERGLATMLPVAAPLLQDNPVRARIKPESYNEIYTKIIMQCRTPTVPINLADVTKACVRGWIAEGNWPPKPGPPDPLLGRARRKGERHPHFRKGVEAVGRVLGLGTSERPKTS